MTDETLEQLRVEDIHKSFLSHTVLKGISLTANRGDVISIIGSSGSGKSTFLRCINFLETPDSGRIVVRGEEVKTRHDKRFNCLVPTDKRQLQRMRTRLAMVFQHFNLWSHMSALDNVMAAPVNVLKRDHKTVKKEAQDYLREVGLTDDVFDKYPSQLSGGQQQRVAIARALALEPEVLLFDEPTSALDPELVGEVLKSMRLLADEGRTMVVVTHEMAFARNVSNKVMFFHQGKVEEQGDPEKVFDAPESARLAQFLSGSAQ